MYLSPKKQKFVNFILGFTHTNERPPTFVEIMKGLNISSLGTIHWYVTELEKEGVIKRTRGHQGKRALSILEQNLRITLPLLGIVQAGYPLEVFEDNEQIEVPPSYINEHNFVLRVRGDSMIEEHIQEGDFIIVRECKTAQNGELVIAYINNEATLKRYYYKENQIELHPSNSNFNIIIVNPEDDFRIGGTVLSVMRNYK
ncbi:MAG: repressor LexA [Candidatus Marinimicrobia bacterium]|nr:repressor LexA [Candidatus Neomarinimicrobiota bacterium]